jgi:cobalt-precorrin 5A hydrolase
MERGAMRRVAGLGCREGAPLAALREALAEAAGDQPVDALATLSGREAMVRPLAHSTGLPLIVLAPEAIAGLATPTQSPRIAALYATGCVAEATALAALGPGARIAVSRRVSPDGSATAAIAILEQP